MTGTADVSDDSTVRQRPSPRAADGPIDLEAVVVRYDDRPDRCTLVPRGCPDERKLTTWYSANLTAFVDLGDAR
ncbi:DUF7511 domain-containing protein [Salinilacihabitans rarus]|uniref:DUF7511 domain-containing protein n=1 Tax=Salinilacihabitans rarus TaxID=2961596 RepID=UPI0020C9282F|nr:hypothetical protein [Salinilacihabitans rarus]